MDVNYLKSLLLPVTRRLNPGNPNEPIELALTDEQADELVEMYTSNSEKYNNNMMLLDFDFSCRNKNKCNLSLKTGLWEYTNTCALSETQSVMVNHYCISEPYNLFTESHVSNDIFGLLIVGVNLCTVLLLSIFIMKFE